MRWRRPAAGSASPGETRLRLALVRAGLPEPELNVRLYGVDGRYLGKPDIVYRRQRVVFEYEGDGHRLDGSSSATTSSATNA